MDADHLRNLFVAQQTRRQTSLAGLVAAAQPALRANPRPFRIKIAVFTLLAVFLVSALVAAILNNTVMPSSEPAVLATATLPAHVMVVTATATEVQFVIDRQVCTNVPGGYLNVRFSPIGPVRGYLTEGEIVRLSTDRHTGDIKIQDVGSLWIHLQSPIEGWVNARYICFINGEED